MERVNVPSTAFEPSGALRSADKSRGCCSSWERALAVLRHRYAATPISGTSSARTLFFTGRRIESRAPRCVGDTTKSGACRRSIVVLIDGARVSIASDGLGVAAGDSRRCARRRAIYRRL
jgi:hypothetical protein